MKKKFMAAAMAALMAMSMAGCGSSAKETTAAAAETTTAAAAETTTAAETTAAAAETTKAEGGTLIMGTNAEFPPYEFRDGDKIVGIDVEIAQAVAEKMGMTLEIEDMAFDAVIPSVTSGKIDFGAAGMTVTEERKQSVDFTDTYATSTQVIIVKNDSDITNLDGLKNKIIGVQLGTTGDILAGDIEGATLERYNKGMEAVQSLTQNKVDAVVIDDATAKAFVSNNEGIKILEEKLSDEEYAIAVKKGNTELVENMNAAIKELKESGKLDEIVAKYIKAE